MDTGPRRRLDAASTGWLVVSIVHRYTSNRLVGLDSGWSTSGPPCPLAPSSVSVALRPEQQHATVTATDDRAGIVDRERFRQRPVGRHLSGQVDALLSAPQH